MREPTVLIPTVTTCKKTITAAKNQFLQSAYVRKAVNTIIHT